MDACSQPSGAPDPAKVGVAPLKGVPHLVVYGDFLDKSAFWQKILPKAVRPQPSSTPRPAQSAHPSPAEVSGRLPAPYSGTLPATTQRL